TEIVVVAAEGQVLPPLPGCRIEVDTRPDLGPLEGIRVGLAVLEATCDAAYVTSCDAPRLAPGFVKVLATRLGDFDLAIPDDGEFRHPLAAVYRTGLHRLAAALLS